MCALALGAAACSDPDLNSDLDSEGPPEVLLVTVTSEADGTSLPLQGPVPDAAIYCAAAGRVNLLLCGEGARAITDATPMGWSVRVAFSELLMADMVETLIDTDDDGVVDTGTLATTQPVTLTCDGTVVAYDGFYDPSGNAHTYPPGPSLVVSTSEFVRTGTTNCALTVGNKIMDKDSNPLGGTDAGPYTFDIATMKIAGASPDDMATGVDPTMSGMAVAFNAPIDDTTAAQITVNDGTANIAFTAMASPEDPSQLLLVPDADALAENTTYTVTVPVAVGITDTLGGELEIGEDFVYSFTTGTPPPAP